jgi:hypothetical protein
MDLMLLRTFQRQVADQCKVVVTGAQMINGGLRSPQQSDAVWIGAQVLVTGAGNVSKALWGQARRLSTERQPLRDSLGVDDASPFYDVSIRNHFEHYDERLDRWWRDSPNHNHLDRMIGPPSGVVGFDDLDRFRVYDPTTHDLIFWGEAFNVQTIVTEAERLLPVAEREASKPHWGDLSGQRMRSSSPGSGVSP